MANFDETIGGVNFMVVGKNVMLLTDDGMDNLDRDDVLKLAEFAAAAYEALEGAPYTHAEYDKGLVTIVKEGEYVIPKQHIADPAFNAAFDRLERDCE